MCCIRLELELLGELGLDYVAFLSELFFIQKMNDPNKTDTSKQLSH